LKLPLVKKSSNPLCLNVEIIAIDCKQVVYFVNQRLRKFNFGFLLVMSFASFVPID
jgi:hypothetical protein